MLIANASSSEHLSNTYKMWTTALKLLLATDLPPTLCNAGQSDPGNDARHCPAVHLPLNGVGSLTSLATIWQFCRASGTDNTDELQRRSQSLYAEQLVAYACAQKTRKHETYITKAFVLELTGQVSSYKSLSSGDLALCIDQTLLH